MTAAEVRDRLTHPVIDVDGHMIEYFPALSGYLRKEGIDPASPSMQRLVPGAFGPTVDWHSLTTEQRAGRRVPRPPWWGSPARNTRDLATAMFPRSSTNAFRSSASTSRSCTRASGSCTCTSRTNASGVARAGR